MSTPDNVTLHSYCYSVYAWIAKLALYEKRIDYTWEEVDPFAEQVPQQYLKLNPFCRVPTLVHDQFVLYETSAIVRYLDEKFPGPSLQPDDVGDRARMTQIISIIDSYGYWPLVRQVFAHGFWQAQCGLDGNVDELQRGLQAAPRVLNALSDLAGDGAYLTGTSLSLGDLYLLPMLAYFNLCGQVAELVSRHRGLSSWLTLMASRESYAATKPNIPGL